MITRIDNYDLTPRNTFAMKVKCGAFMEYTKAADIPFLLSSVRKDVDTFHIGAGSNLLFTRDFPGVVFHSAIKGYEILCETPEEIIVRVGSGEVMDDFVSWACSRGLWGIENLSGIPGEVGASAVQNVGAYGTEASDVIKAVHAYDKVGREFVTFTNEQCCYGYRDSIFKKADSKRRYIIHAVDYILSPVKGPNLSYPALKKLFENTDLSGISPNDVRAAVIATRDSKLPDPSIIPSAGSFFKNPVISEERFNKLCETEGNSRPPYYKVSTGYKIPAAWLIDQCGWKGYEEGNVGVWRLQPLVIVNSTGCAAPDEVMALEKKIIQSVHERFDINLSPEVEHI